jgi:hypothetical protein
MDHKVSLFILVLLTSFVQIKVCAQEAIILDGFTGIPGSTEVQLRWVISAGQTCNGTFIERSTDTIHWNTIGDIPGICGSSSAPVPYNFTDESPVKNTINFYRLELGGQGYSPLISVPFYDFTEQGFVVIPNPADDFTTVYFSTSETEAYTIKLFSLSGILMQQYTGTGSSRKLEISHLAAGTYIFVILREGKKNVSGKLSIR